MHQIFQWINEPATWSEEDGELRVVTDAQTDFWRETWYGFERFSGISTPRSRGGLHLSGKGCEQISVRCMTRQDHVNAGRQALD